MFGFSVIRRRAVAGVVCLFVRLTNLPAAPSFGLLNCQIVEFFSRPLSLCLSV